MDLRPSDPFCFRRGSCSYALEDTSSWMPVAIEAAEKEWLQLTSIMLAKRLCCHSKIAVCSHVNSNRENSHKTQCLNLIRIQQLRILRKTRSSGRCRHEGRHHTTRAKGILAIVLHGLRSAPQKDNFSVFEFTFE
eukprot:1622801-Amphidinium_carterae.1